MSAALPVLTVIRTRDLALHLRRIVLGGPALKAFPPECDGATVDLVFGHDAGAPIRAYHVAHHDATAGELTLDFVLHEAGGPAADWARRATPGASLGLVAPAPAAVPQPAADWYLLAGDASGFAWLSAVLRNLPRTARGHALIEIGNPADRVPLERPGGIAVRWLVRGAHTRPGASTMLVDVVREMETWDKPPSVALAGEDTQVAALSAYLLGPRALPPQLLVAHALWKDGVANDVYRAG